jgi:hypothetical protein
MSEFTPVDQEIIQGHVCNTCRPFYKLPTIRCQAKTYLCVVCEAYGYGGPTDCSLNDRQTLEPITRFEDC